MMPTRNTTWIATIALVSVLGCRNARPLPVDPLPVAQAPDPTTDHAVQLAHMGADAVLWQHASAEYHRIAQQGYELARLRLAENLRVTDARPSAVIVDIDETVLDNSPYQLEAVAKGKPFDQATWLEWTTKASAKATPGALEFLKYADEQGCIIFYITNRDVRERAATLKNLQDLGFPDADVDHLLLMEGTSDKTERRARVASDHRIVLLVGDQLRDFDERFKDRTVDHGRPLVDTMTDTLSRYFVLLPNPMYGTYRDAVQGKGTDAEKLARMKAWFEQGH
ncbi:MAG TPA: 5'-nucleotidase, lipoprotein e(P4) family [Flavobacteriales bacterium]|jgi:5'-nucleotidase (lipoprotein e(P4) family)|nr:5'-nucleotidase, lipoprotein e(P4) family [Flavobacteriales bacterium]